MIKDSPGPARGKLFLSLSSTCFAYCCLILVSNQINKQATLVVVAKAGLILYYYVELLS